MSATNNIVKGGIIEKIAPSIILSSKTYQSLKTNLKLSLKRVRALRISLLGLGLLIIIIVMKGVVPVVQSPDVKYADLWLIVIHYMSKSMHHLTQNGDHF